MFSGHGLWPWGCPVPALADAMGETRVGFRFGETFYSYDVPASGRRLEL